MAEIKSTADMVMVVAEPDKWVCEHMGNMILNTE